MPTFAYTARCRGQKTLSGVLAAGDRNEVAARLKRMGYFPLSVEPTDYAASDDGLLARAVWRRVSREDVSVFTTQLASLLKAGLPLASALKSLEEQGGRTRIARVIERLRRHVSESGALSEAMAEVPRLFPRTYTAAVRAGEEGGMLTEVLTRVAKNLKVEIEVRGRIRGALAYPIFLCILGGVTLFVLMTFVIPRFTKLFATMGEHLPLPTRILLGFSNTMDASWPLVGLALIAAVIFLTFMIQWEASRAIIDRWLLAVPLIGSIIHRSEIARLARTMSELLTSRVPILTSLQITQGVMKNRCFIADVDELRVSVAKGNAIATKMKDLPHFGPLVTNMVAVGEQGGQLPELLMEVAEIYEKECERAIQGLTTILGPSLIVLIGGVIAFVITAILLPVFQASTLVG